MHTMNYESKQTQSHTEYNKEIDNFHGTHLTQSN